MTMCISPELEQDILDLNATAGDKGILLAAQQDKIAADGSLGTLLLDAGYSPRHGSAIAAILHHELLIDVEKKMESGLS